MISVIEFKLVYYVYFVSTDKKTQEDIPVPHLRPEVLDTIRMEDLIKEHLTSKENVSIYHKLLFLHVCCSVKSVVYVIVTQYWICEYYLLSYCFFVHK